MELCGDCTGNIIQGLCFWDAPRGPDSSEHGSGSPGKKVNTGVTNVILMGCPLGSFFISPTNL